MVAEITQTPAEDMGPVDKWGSISRGSEAVADFTSVIRAAAKDFLDNAEDPVSGADLKRRLDAVADSVEAFFKPSDFEQIINVRHTIAEDGDVEYNILMAQKPDGTWKTLTHTDFPF